MGSLLDGTLCAHCGTNPAGYIPDGTNNLGDAQYVGGGASNSGARSIVELCATYPTRG